MDMKSHTIFYSGKEEGTRGFGVAFIVERDMKMNVLDFKAVSERICLDRCTEHFFNQVKDVQQMFKGVVSSYFYCVL
jgi:hypothetical protein